MTRPPLPYSGLHRPAGRILLPFRSAAGPNNLADCSAGMYSPAGYSAGMYNPAGRSAGMYSLAGCPAPGITGIFAPHCGQYCTPSFTFAPHFTQ